MSSLVRMISRAAGAVLVGLALAGEGAAQQGRPASSLAGTVVDEGGAPLARARVTLAPLGRSAETDAEGRFAFGTLPGGSYRAHATLMGYAPVVRQVVVGAAGTEARFVLQATPLTLEEVQVTATPAAADARAVAQATTQLSGKALERNMAGTVAQTLATQPGIRVRYNGPAAAVPIMRGLTGDRILILQDGQRSADLAGSAVDHAVTIDPLTAQRIEVVRGPATLLYGNNALGGVVNVISGDIPTSVPGSVGGVAVGQTESAYPGAGGSFRVNAPLGDRWAATVRGGGRSAGDVRIGPDPTLGSRLGNTDSRNWTGAAGLGYVGSRLTAGAAVRGYQFAYGLPVPPGSGPVRLRGDRLEGTGRAQMEMPSMLFPSVRAEGTVQDYAHDELDETGDVQMAFGLRTQTANVLLRQGPVGPFSEGAWGISALGKQYASTGPAALTPAANSRTWGAFGFQEMALRAGGPALQLGGRYDHYEIASADSPKFGPGVDRTFRALSGSLGLRLPLSEALSVGASLSRSFRAPTVEELFSGALHAGTGSVEYGSPTLAAERGTGLDGVVRLRTRRWNGQFVAYRNHIQNYVHLLAQPDTVVGGQPVSVFRYGQTDATLQGMEGSVEWAARPDLAVGVSGDLLHAAQRDGTPLSFMPPPRVGGFARWDDGTWSLGADVHHEMKQDRVGSADESRTPAHTVVRVDAGLRITRGRMVHSITLRGENLGNELHREATSRIKDFAPSPGRNLALMYRVIF
ncbi:MAG TPA: TonB-dependent receptor [Longimicrobium sp.]|nr:TonB-dependent receptor [Longimicrobium sp.]